MAELEKVIRGLECVICPNTFCGNCAYFVRNENDPDTGWCDRDAIYKNALELLKAQEPKWISVKDRLPELNQDVLVYAVGKIDGFVGETDIEICNRYIQRIFPSSPGVEIWSSPRQYFHTDYEITHWMPLPEPPKEG